jgi:peptidyl-tRNA hydrolase
MLHIKLVIEDEIEYTKGVNRIREAKNDRQHNGQKKKDKMTYDDYISLRLCMDSCIHAELTSE